MSNQTIHELTNLSEISTNDEIPIWDNSAGTTKKVSVEELSLAVNNTNSYSTEEHLTGRKWLDGKPTYEKTIEFGALPDNASKNVLHNIANLDNVVKFTAIASRGTRWLPLPFSSTSSLTRNVDITISQTAVEIVTGINRSEYTQTYVTIEYTKTTA